MVCVRLLQGFHRRPNRGQMCVVGEHEDEIEASPSRKSSWRTPRWSMSAKFSRATAVRPVRAGHDKTDDRGRSVRIKPKLSRPGGGRCASVFPHPGSSEIVTGPVRKRRLEPVRSVGIPGRPQIGSTAGDRGLRQHGQARDQGQKEAAKKGHGETNDGVEEQASETELGVHFDPGGAEPAASGNLLSIGGMVRQDSLGMEFPLEIRQDRGEVRGWRSVRSPCGSRRPVPWPQKYPVWSVRRKTSPAGDSARCASSAKRSLMSRRFQCRRLGHGSGK